MHTPDILPLILAGGRGTRIAHLHPHLPKPAIPVAGKPLLAWIVGQLQDAGFVQMVISAGHLASRLRAAMEAFVPAGVRLTWVEEPTPMGTGGGAAHAARCSGSTPSHWLVLNGDSFLASDWPRRLRGYGKAAMTIVAKTVPDTQRYGRLVTEPDGRLTVFAEKKSGGPGLINAGIYAIPSAWLAEVPAGKGCGMETELIPGWLAEGRPIEVLHAGGEFLDVGTPESLERADEFFHRHGTIRSPMATQAHSSPDKEGLRFR